MGSYLVMLLSNIDEVIPRNLFASLLDLEADKANFIAASLAI